MTGSRSGGEAAPSADPDDPLPRPPHRFVDDEGRSVDVRRFDGDTEALVEMYEALAPADRAQGLPPRGETRLRAWLDTLAEEGLALVAWHGDLAVGHAALVPMDGTRWELAVFVRSDYQAAHVGSHLTRCLLGAGRAAGVERVWLTVERHNNHAVALYRSIGFETTDDGPEYEMERRL